MIAVAAAGLGHRFQQRWIFRDLSFELTAGQTLCLTGPNGSGKSTLLRIVAGQLSPTSGTATLTESAGPVAPEDRWRQLSWAAPYVEHFNYLRLEEAFRLHHRLRPLVFSPAECLARLQLTDHAQQPLGRLSSGQRQRALVGLALFTKCGLLLLDEPTSFLDPRNTAFVLDLIETVQGERTLILATNRAEEIERYPRRLDLLR